MRAAPLPAAAAALVPAAALPLPAAAVAVVPAVLVGAVADAPAALVVALLPAADAVGVVVALAPAVAVVVGVVARAPAAAFAAGVAAAGARAPPAAAGVVGLAVAGLFPVTGVVVVPPVAASPQPSIATMIASVDAHVVFRSFMLFSAEPRCKAASHIRSPCEFLSMHTQPIGPSVLGGYPPILSLVSHNALWRAFLRT